MHSILADFWQCSIFWWHSYIHTMKKNEMNNIYFFTKFALIIDWWKYISDVCSLRLDFLTFNTQAGDFAAATPDVAAHVVDSLGACRDTFAVITNTNGGDTPVVCGQNDGEHSKLLTTAILHFKNTWIENSK